MMILLLTTVVGLRFAVRATKQDVTLGDKILFALASLSCLLFLAASQF